MPARSRIILRTLPSAGIILASAAVLGAVVSLSEPEQETPRESPPLGVTVTPAQWDDTLTITTRYQGEVRARQRIDLSFDIAGTIERIEYDDGDPIDAGSPVASLDTSRLEADLSRLLAARDAQTADLDFAERTLRRFENLAEASAVNEQEFDEAESAVTRLRALLARAEADIERTRIDLQESTIYAPFDAIVVRRHTDVGANVLSGTGVATLIERSNPEARIGVTPEDAQQIQGDLHLSIRGKTYKGSLTSILPETDRLTRTVELRIALDTPLGPTLRDGDTVELITQRTIQDAGVWVDVSALTQSVRGLWALYIATPTGPDTWTLERREVEVLRPEEDRAYVRGAISEGELIITDGKQRLVPGIAVRPSETEQALKAKAAP